VEPARWPAIWACMWSTVAGPRPAGRLRQRPVGQRLCPRRMRATRWQSGNGLQEARAGGPRRPPAHSPTLMLPTPRGPKKSETRRTRPSSAATSERPRKSGRLHAVSGGGSPPSAAAARRRRSSSLAVSTSGAHCPRLAAEPRLTKNLARTSKSIVRQSQSQ
jgi:hypothetical protein